MFKNAFGMLLLAAATQAGSDPCMAINDCTDCIDMTGCGWCSEPVLYASGKVGSRCAGPKFGNPFSCPSIYSTDTCVQGYMCNHETQKCEKAAPGEGKSLEDCSKTCGPGPAAVYKCDEKQKKCFIAPPGTAGAAAKSVCDETCGKVTPSHSPAASHAPASSHAPPASHAPAPKPKPTPGPAPPVVNTVWRGIFVQKGYTAGEVDVVVTDSAATVTFGGKVWAQGNATHTSAQDMAITLESGSVGAAGDVVPMYFQLVGQAPEVGFAEVSVGALNGDVPSGAAAVMSGTSGLGVMELMKCMPGDKACSFYAGATSRGAAVQAATSPVDPCHQAATCSDCLALNPQCGWCAKNVIYTSGQVGGQCAGTNSGITKFVCEEMFSTDTCLQGYTCNTETGSCEKAAPGNGMPLAQCQAQCKKASHAPSSHAPSSHSPSSAGPSSKHPSSHAPAPKPAKMYHCNFTSLQCEEGGSQTHEQCTGLCVKPTPNTPTELQGLWRGLEINAAYAAGEFDLKFTNTSATLTLDGEAVWTADVYHFENVYLRLKLTSGRHQGLWVDALYQMAAIGSVEVDAVTFVMGGYGGGMPEDFAAGMHAPNTEHVLYRCKPGNQACLFA